MTSLKDPVKPKSVRNIVTITFLSFLTFAVLLQDQSRVVSTTTTAISNIMPSSTIPLCGRIILVSGARHGSTWFISSADGCTAKDSHTFGNLNSESELWVHHQGALDEISPSGAVEYVKTNRSIKVMPMALNKHGEELREFLKLVGNTVPIFVLRRPPEDSYASLNEAKETRTWMRNKINVSERGAKHVIHDERFEIYRRKLDKFFEDVKKIMKECGNVWDEVDYDVVSMRRVIVGRRNRCFVRNCNF